MYEADDYHGEGGGHYTQAEEADTERARLKRSASLTSSSHRSHQSRHREGHGVTASANQRAVLWHKRPIRGQILRLSQSPVISFRNNGSKYGNYELTPIFIFDKDTVDQYSQKFELKAHNAGRVLWFLIIFRLLRLNNMNFRHQRAHKMFPITPCHLEDTLRSVSLVCLLLIHFTSISYFPGQVSEDGD